MKLTGNNEKIDGAVLAQLFPERYVGTLRYGLALQPCVYVVRQPGEILYVGSSVKGIGRAVEVRHHALAQFQDTAEVVIDIFICPNEEACRAMEEILIVGLKPRLNKAGPKTMTALMEKKFSNPKALQFLAAALRQLRSELLKLMSPQDEIPTR